MNNKDVLAIGYYMGVYRRYKGYKQIMVAKDIGISASMLSRIENGIINDESINIIYNVAKYYGINIEEFERKRKILREYVNKMYYYRIFMYENKMTGLYEEYHRLQADTIDYAFHIESVFIELIYRVSKLMDVEVLFKELENAKPLFDESMEFAYYELKSAVYFNQHDFENTLACLHSIRNINISIDSHGYYCQRYGEVLFEMNELAMAEDYLKRALDVYATTLNVYQMVNVQKDMIQILEQSGKNIEANKRKFYVNQCSANFS